MVAKVAHIDNQGQADKGSKGLTFPRTSIMTNIRSQRIIAPACNQSRSSQLEVYLISLRNHYKVVAKGKLVTSDSTQSIAGTVLGKEFVGVYVDALGDGNSGDEMLPRPFHSIKTMSDAIGFVVAWPSSHVSFLLY
ncbi:uncharacterized protein [Miscanthus floridulus]|uniref:uncharacterized protein n=1 Tax=Miscanthus floridulus TaxID=154761 RepID=UPI003458225C